MGERETDTRRDGETEGKARNVAMLGAVHKKVKKLNSKKLKVYTRSLEAFRVE